MADNKKLYLVRHGKSSWGYENVSDMDRPLKNKGINNSYEMSKMLKERNIQPDLIISSPAIRALHTALIFAKELDYPYSELKIKDIIYFSDEHSILSFIKNSNDAADNLMIFGHNPVISELANMFLKNKVDYISTAGVVELVFNTSSWTKIAKENLVGELYETPKKG